MTNDHQVIGAQQVEGGGHLRAFEIAARIHLLLEVGELSLVDEHAKLARFREIQQAGKERRTSDALLSLGRKIRERTAEQRATQAVTDDIDLSLTRRLLDGIERGDWPFKH